MKRALLCIPLLVRMACAQATASAPDQDRELIQQLLARVQQLEAEVKELKTRLGTTAAAPAAAPAEPAPAKEAPRLVEPIETMHETAAGRAFSGMQFRGFSDVQYRATDLRGDHNSFSVGQFNLFITSKLSDRIKFLAEAVLEAGEDNRFGFELERLLLQYSASDYFNVSFGRYHTAIGFYNTAYHHATWLQTAIGRPMMFAFEDEGGVLPIHNVGLSATGRIPSGALGLRYIAEVGNGRTSRTPFEEPVQNVVDENNRKALNIGIFARPDAWRGFQAGFSVYRDKLTPIGLPRIGQTILAGHAVYQSSRFEFLNELVVLRHGIEGARQPVRIPGFYSQISRRFGTVRPYFRYEYIHAPDRDPLFSDLGKWHGPSLGIRYDFSELAAFKLQYDRTERSRLGSFNGVTTQLSFTF